MSVPRLEVAEVFRSCQDDYFEAYPCSPEQRRVFRQILACRTAALGGHVKKCEHCDHQEIAYNSCRNRHCPKCQAKSQSDWLQARAGDLLQVPYVHVVFTLPALLGPLALQNQRLLYGFLFRAASETLLTIAGDRKHLGAKIGFLALLHTWGQNLHHHPHLHCLVPAGGISPDGLRWVHSRPNFFLSVRVLARLFQKKFLHYLRQAYRDSSLAFHGQLRPLAQPSQWAQLLAGLQRTDWVVYSKPPFGSPKQVLKYLARYTHRLAISNSRLLALADGNVSFRYRDYKHHHSSHTLTLQTVEFTRRFLLHVLPPRFMRIRYYGFLAHRCRKHNLALCRQLLAPTADPANPDTLTPSTESAPLCPICRKGASC